MSENGVIDVRPVYNNEKSEIEFSFELSEDDYSFSDIEFLTPVNVYGKITQKASGKGKNEGYVELNLKVFTEISTECARCLEPINEKLSYEKIYGLTQTSVSDDSEEYISTPGGMLNAVDAARTLFLLNMPMRFLCFEDCRGLCSGCGANLNKTTCECEKSEVDPRLAVLKNLKFD